MSFEKNKYLILKNAISEDMALLAFNYLRIKKQVLQSLKDRRIISPYETLFGTLGDDQIPIPETYCCYSDALMETLLLKLLPTMCEKTNLKLVPTYSYTRLYSYGSVLKRHKDRESCEISTTLNLGGDSWPIYLKTENKKEIKVNLKPGDMLIYSGCDLEHWRDKFTGNECGQVFLHYNREGKNANLCDGRIHIGYPIKE